MGPYDDILDLERPVSPKHPPMPRADRAKQFMPFASLRGFDDVIDDRGMLRVPRQGLSEDDRAVLDTRIRSITDALSAGDRPDVRLQVFAPDAARSDETAERGFYREITGCAEKFDPVERTLRVDGVWYPLAQVDDVQLTSPKKMI